jgi:hypothetical protein
MDSSNKTSTPLELKINFPADSFKIPPTPDSYLKLFMVPESIYYSDYGSRTLNSFLDNELNKPTTLQKSINPKEEYLFYIGIATTGSWGGMVRTGLITKGQELFYKVSIIPHFDSLLFPCGLIVFKK